MASTYTDQLASVQAAIAKIEGSGQAYSLAERSLSYASLETLYARERWLLKQVAREARGGRPRLRSVEPI